MKRLLASCLAVLLMLSLAACGSEKPAETEVPVTTTESPMTTAATEVAETEPVPETTEDTSDEGYLFLNVSKIAFSLVGESENIYIGTIPVDQVSWESADESVATFENGVLTATGVGETTVAARCGSDFIEVQVSCLAQTQEELDGLDEAVRRSPKRYPPVIGDEPMDYFADTAIVGDSISYIMFQWETLYNYLGDPVFMVRGGSSLNGIVRDYMQIYYKGTEARLEEAILDAGVNKVFIMLGQNDLRYRTIEETMESWEIILQRIREKTPDVEVHIQSVIPEWLGTFDPNDRNIKIAACNEELKAFAEKNDCRYVDIYRYVEDHTGKMATTYELDKSIHMNEAGCYSWMQALKAYALLEQR